MIVDCAVYERGRRREGELKLAEAFDACQRDGAFVWLGLHEPTEAEFESVRREFNLHELAVEDAIKAHQRPKLELYGDTLLVVLKPVRYVDTEEVIESGEILLFVNETFVVTVRHGEASALSGVRRFVDQRPELLNHGPGAVLYAIVDHIVDDYEPVVDGVAADIQEIEEQVFAHSGDNPAERIYKIEREVLEFHRAVTPLAAPMDRLVRGHFELIDDELRAYFRDVHDHLLRVAQQVEGFRDLLSSMLQVNLTQVSVRQSEDMRKISAWVAILAIPTCIAGLYGMNFDHMPELHWRFGYPLVLGVVLMVCLALYVRFRRAGWL